MTKTKKISNIIFVLLIIAMVSIAVNIHSCNKANERNAEIDRINEEANQRVEYAENVANNAIDRADKLEIESAEYRAAMEAAETNAAEKNELLMVERKKREEIEKALAEITSGNPCDDLNFGEIDFEGAKLKITSLCKINSYLISLNVSYGKEVNYLNGIIINKNEALFNCNKMAERNLAQANEYKTAADKRLEAINEFKNVIVPGLEKKIRNNKHRKFWQRMRDYLIGAAFGVAGIAILK